MPGTPSRTTTPGPGRSAGARTASRGSADRQLLCLALAFWNGRDKHLLKERLFGLTGGDIDRGNHGEDAKECWWYLDATPTHSWMRWRYHYPQRPFAYARLVEENSKLGTAAQEFELLDTDAFEGERYWRITVDYAKASAQDICVRIEVFNAGPGEDTLQVLPTFWFRNTWSWDTPPPPRPVLRAADRDGAVIIAEHSELGKRRLIGSSPRDLVPDLLFCDNESNRKRLRWNGVSPPYPKDGINDYVVNRDRGDTVNPDRTGTKAALRYRLTVPGREKREIRLRFSTAENEAGADLEGGFDAVLAAREREADEFYAALTPEPYDSRPDEQTVLRQAFAGTLGSKQFYH